MDAHHSSRVSPETAPHRSQSGLAPAGGQALQAPHLRVVSSQRSVLREERHPNAVTAPPVNRGSMAPVPWRGFWNSVSTAVLLRLTGRTGAAHGPALPQDDATQAWQGAAQRRRWTFMVLTVL